MIIDPYEILVTEDEKSSNVVWHHASVKLAERNNSNGHKSAVLWFTGLSGSGKSTLANVVDKILFDMGCKTYILDGDNIRHGLNSDLTFTDSDRVENIRRIGEVSKLFVDAGLLVCSAFISPFHTDRNMIRKLLGSEQFIEVFVDTPLEVCEQRDPKGLYKKARLGEIKNFTGIDSDYEVPINPNIIIETAKFSIEEAAMQVVNYLLEKGYINKN